tara:strand:+ start:112 stop:417 length:306 start_codon:yes stop_codon:yes gene_type:complete
MKKIAADNNYKTLKMAMDQDFRARNVSPNEPGSVIDFLGYSMADTNKRVKSLQALAKQYEADYNDMKEKLALFRESDGAAEEKKALMDASEKYFKKWIEQA